MIRMNVKTNRLPQIAARLEPQVAGVTNNAMLSLLMYADATTPVETGALRANKTVIFARPGSMTAKATWNQEYGPFVHEGTKHMEGRPFAQDALDTVEPIYLDALKSMGLV